MNLNIQIKFAKIYSNFLNEVHTPKDISELIETIRYNSSNISYQAKKTLLQIPLCVLEDQVQLKDYKTWVSNNSSYFAGNCSFEPFHSTFNSGNFDLKTMYDYLKDIISDSQKINSDFCLRNIEVTFRDDVVTEQYSTFKESGKIYARIMEQAFDC